MSGTTNSGAAPSTSRFWVTLKQDSEDTYILLHEDMRKSIASPCGIRLIDIGECQYENARFQSLCFIEARRKGEGAIGSFSKDGFAQYIAKNIAYTSFMSDFDALARLGSDSPSGQQHRDDPVENSPRGVIVRKMVLDHFRERWKKGRGYRGVRYIWIDRLCILQNEEDLRWHDVDFQVDIHSQAVQCFAAQDGLPNALLNARLALLLSPINRSSSPSRQHVDRHLPLSLCSRSNGQTLRDVLHSFLSANASRHEHPATQNTTLGSIREILTCLDRVTNKPRKFDFLAKAQAGWGSLFTKTYPSHNEFIKACRKHFTLETTNEERATDLDLVMLAAQLSRMVDIPVFWLGVVIDVPPDPIFPLFPAIGHARPTSPMTDSLFVRDPSLRTEFHAQTPCTLILRNAAVRGLVPYHKGGAKGASLQLPWDPLHDWVTEDEHSGCTKTWLVYLGSMNRCPGGKSHEEPIVSILEFSTQASGTSYHSSRFASSSQAAAKLLAPPDALKYHFMVLEEDVTDLEHPECEDEDEGRLQRGPKKICQLKGWLGKDVSEWLTPTGWSRRHTFSIVVRPEVASRSRQHTSSDFLQPEVDDPPTYQQPGVGPPPTYEETQALDRVPQTPADSPASRGAVPGVARLPLAQPRPMRPTLQMLRSFDEWASASVGRTRSPSTQFGEDDEDVLAGTVPSSRAPSPADTDLTLVGDVDDPLQAPPVSPCMSQSSVTSQPACSLRTLGPDVDVARSPPSTLQPGRIPLSRASDFQRMPSHR